MSLEKADKLHSEASSGEWWIEASAGSYNLMCKDQHIAEKLSGPDIDFIVYVKNNWPTLKQHVQSLQANQKVAIPDHIRQVMDEIWKTFYDIASGGRLLSEFPEMTAITSLFTALSKMGGLSQEIEFSGRPSDGDLGQV